MEFWQQQRRGLKKVGRTGSCNFPADSCKFLIEKTMGNCMLKISILPQISPKWGFSDQILHFG